MNCRFVTGSVRPCPSNDQSTFLFPACQACRREIVASELFPPAVRRARAAGGLRGVFAQQLPGGLALPGSTPRWTRIALILVSAVSGISAAYEIRGGPTTALILFAALPQQAREFYAPIIAWRRWKQPRSSSRRAGSSGRHGGAGGSWLTLLLGVQSAPFVIDITAAASAIS